MNTRKFLLILILVPTFHACSHKPAVKHEKHTKVDKKKNTEVATRRQQKAWRSIFNR